MGECIYFAAIVATAMTFIISHAIDALGSKSRA